MSEQEGSSASPATSAETLKPMSELGRHQVVQDRIDSGVGVLHDPGKVEKDVVPFDTKIVEAVGVDDDPEGDDAEGK